MQRQLYTFSVRVEIKERENLREGYNPSGRTCGDLSGWMDCTLERYDARKRCYSLCAREPRRLPFCVLAVLQRPLCRRPKP